MGSTESELTAAVESGGTKFRAAVVDADLNIVDQTRIPTTTPEETLAAVVAFFAEQPPVAALGVASFGPLIVDADAADYGALGPTPKPGWSGTPLLSHLVAALGVPGDIETDVEAAAVAEYRLGAGRGKSSVAYVTVGTGVGIGVAIDGVAFRGRDHIELGHIAIRRGPTDTFAGRCPFHGDCLEGMACGPAIEERWGARPSALADREDVWDLEADYLGQLVRTLAYAFAPDIILFSGGVGARPDLAPRIAAAATMHLGGYSVSHADNAELVATAQLGNDAGLLGAALLSRAVLTRSVLAGSAD